MKNHITSHLCILFIFCFPILGKAQIDPNDRLALIALYDATDGANWTNTWDLNQPAETWYGVTLDGDGRVIELDLVTNQLSGSIPPELGNLNSLTVLSLFDNQLNGSIPAELSTLTNLEDLLINDNQLSGNIPSDLGQLTNLRNLSIGSNQLNGSIPVELINLINLIRLSLASNLLNGSIPEGFGNLDSLEILSLNDNQLTGNIPAEIGNLTELRALRLYNNQLNGCYDTNLINLCDQLLANDPTSISDGNNLDATWTDFCNTGAGTCLPCSETDSLALVALHEDTNGSGWLPNTWDLMQPMNTWHGVTVNGEGCVTELDLSFNQLTGNLPVELSDLTNLERLVLGVNQLSGTIPPELSNLSILQVLDLSSNELSGTIPTELADLDSLTVLNLFDNQLNGNIPTELGDLDKLTRLALSDNQLSGSLPIELGELTNLTELALSNNQFSGSIPPELGNLNSLAVLNLFDNQLNGSIPTELGDLTNLIQLALFNNQLSGCYDTNLMNWCNQQFPFGISISEGNNFDATWDEFCNTGAGTCIIPCIETDSLALIALYDATNGASWTNTWDLTQPINTWHGVVLNVEGCVMELNLQNNQISGNIPPELGELSNLTDLNLFNNQLIGTIPPELGNLENLTRLLLFNNELSGTIPPELSGLSNLTNLVLGTNELSGTIPSELGTLSNLVGLGLSENQLSGSIPSSLAGLANLTDLNLFDNQLTGEIPPGLANLPILTNFRLNDNQLSGTIPAFSTLSVLYVEKNRFLHEDIAANYNVNSSLDTLFTFSPQYYGDLRHEQNNTDEELTLRSYPLIPYANPSVRWLKDDIPIMGHENFMLHDTIFVIDAVDSMDVGIYEYQFIDSTLTPPVEFHSLPINNYVDNLDTEGQPIIPDELILDLTDVPDDEIASVLAYIQDSLGGQPLDTCGCDMRLFLYEFDEDDVYAALDTFGRVESSKEAMGVDGGFNKRQRRPKRPIGKSLYLPEIREDIAFSDDVVVACLDTGIDITHPGIQNRLWINPQSSDETNNCIGGRYGYNFVNKSGDVSDEHGHGTGVGGLIAENIPEEADIRVMPIKVYSDDTLSSLFHLGCGIQYAIDNDADIMNISLGYRGEKSVILENALQRAKDKGIIVVTSAGNDSINIDKNGYWPAGFANSIKFKLSNVLTVAALDSLTNFWTQSNFGPETVNFAVRGQALVVPSRGNYTQLTGTSASAPLAALALALEMASNKNRTYKSVIGALVLKENPALDTLVKGGRWLDIQLDSNVLTLDIKVLLEGASYNLNNGSYMLEMRTDLYHRSILPMSDDGSRIQHRFETELGNFPNDKWNDTPQYSPDVVDWVLVSLRTYSLNPTTTFYKAPAWLLHDGTVRFYSTIRKADIDFDNLGDFYVMIEHHNHLPIITPTPLNKEMNILEFNFIEQNAYNPPTGVGQKEIMPDVWAMYAGNIHNDYLGNVCEVFDFEEITGADKARWFDNNGNFGIYQTSDANLDGDINGADKILWEPNNGIFSATPR